MTMTIIMACLLVTIGVFGCICLHLSARLDDANGRITLSEIKINYLERSEKTIRESIDLQTKCIRDLNDIVKKSVEGKEPTKPDTKALVSKEIHSQIWNVRFASIKSGGTIQEDIAPYVVRS